MKLSYLFFFFFLMHDQKVKTKTYLSWEWKELLRWNKKHFSSVLKDFQSPESAPLINLLRFANIRAWISVFRKEFFHFKIQHCPVCFCMKVGSFELLWVFQEILWKRSAVNSSLRNLLGCNFTRKIILYHRCFPSESLTFL